MKEDGFYNRWTRTLGGIQVSLLPAEFDEHLVNKGAYSRCSERTGEPHDGREIFLLDAPGTFYFASADHNYCSMGQKVSILVLPAHQRPAP